MTAPVSQRLTDAELVTALLAIDPGGLGGVWVRARHGPQRQRLAKTLRALPLRTVRLAPAMDDLALFGGLDLGDSLLAGKPAWRDGLIAPGRALWLSGVEAMEPRRQTRIATAAETGSVLILLDEGARDDPLPHDTLRDRCAFFLDENTATGGETLASLPPAGTPPAALTEARIALLAATAARGGISGLRPLLFATNAARALAALDGTSEVTDDHLATAARLVFGHRALIPAEDDMPAETPPDPDTSAPETADADPGAEELQLPETLLIEAVRTALPGDVLAEIVARTRATSGAGRGDERASLERGRPLPSRPGRLGGRGRPDILATLTAAAPWQRLRGGRSGRLEIRPDDVRIRRFRDHSERLILFVVDASGSAALARLAEGKGAVELLLSRAYSARDFVSMIVFRNEGAELVLPPTRALARARNALTGLPAGGATPLAAGLKLALDVAGQARRRGQTPQVVLISDGRANRTLDGAGDRRTAQTEATTLARHLRAAGIPVALLDTGRRPSRELAALSDTLDSPVIDLPRRLNARSGEAIASAIDTRK